MARSHAEPYGRKRLRSHRVDREAYSTMNRPEQGGDSASGRLSTRSGRGAPRPRVDNPEALLLLPPQPGRTRASAPDVTPAASVGTGNRVQWMIDAIQPRMQSWVEEFLTTELPQVSPFCLDRTIPALVDEHVRSAIPPLLDELLPTLVRREVVTALATVDDESPSGTALKGAISSAVANRLATTFPAEAGIDARAQRNSTAPDFTQMHAEPIGAAPGIGTMAPHTEGTSIYLAPFCGATGGPTDNCPPVLADTAGPRGTENCLGRFATENRQPYRSSRRSAPGAQGFHTEGTENPSEEEIRPRHEATRKYLDGNLGRYRDDCDGRYTRYRDDNRDGRYGRYRDAGGGGYPSDDDDAE